MAVERKYRALLVGNWSYPRDADQLPTLVGPRFDLSLLEAALTDPVTGLHRPEDIAVLADCPRDEILGRLDEFFGDAGREDQVLFYYSGHGRPNLEDQLYLCASDTVTNRLVSTAISASDISQMISACRARAKIVILDCCYSGSFKSGAITPQRLGGEGRFVLTSSRRAQLSDDSTAPNEPSPFTRFLAEALHGGAADGDEDGLISVDDVYRHVRDRLRERAGSTPQRDFDQAVGEPVLARTAMGVALRRPEPRASVQGAAARRVRVVDSSVAAKDLAVGVAAERRGDLHAAVRAFESVRSEGLGDWVALAALHLGHTLERLGEPTPAASAYREAVADGHPDWAPEAACQLGGLLAGADDLSGALAAYQVAIDAHSQEWSPRSAMAAAAMLKRRGDAQAAVLILRDVTERHHGPWADGACLALGELYARLGEIGSARASLSRAVRGTDSTVVGRADRLLLALSDTGATSFDALLVALGGDTRQAEENTDNKQWYNNEPAWRAAEALATFGTDERAVPALISALTAGSLLVTESAARSLGQRRAVDAIEPLVDLLGHADQDVRWAAAGALVSIGDPAVTRIVELLGADDPRANGARSALRSMGGVAALLSASMATAPAAARSEIPELLGECGAEATPALMALLGTKDRTLRHAVGRALAIVGRPAVVELIGRLGDTDPTVRVDAALALGAIQDRRSIPRLEQRLSDPEPSVRNAVARALAGFGDDALPTLVRALLGRDEVAVATALDALVHVGGAAVPRLTQLTTAAPPTAHRACEALRRIGTLPALQHLSEIESASLSHIADP